MKRILASLIALWFAHVPAHAGSMLLLGAGVSTVAVSYTGPGDISVNGSTNNWFAWGSCARVYKTSLASTSTNLCDIVAVTGGAAVCTLRGSSTGFVDLAASYCAGTTPAAACAAASGGSCKVTKVYDQTGNTHDWTQGTLANMPALVFSGLSSLPVLNCPSGSCSVGTGAITQAVPITYSAVVNRTSSGGVQGGILGNNSLSVGLVGSTSANLLGVDGNTALTTQSATDAAWHAANGLEASGTAACFMNIDGSESAGGTCGFTGFSSNTLQWFRIGAVNLVGSMAEAGMLAVTSSATDRNNIRANQKTAYPALP